jgi:hypothetical protein
MGELCEKLVEKNNENKDREVDLLKIYANRAL